MQGVIFRVLGHRPVVSLQSPSQPTGVGSMAWSTRLRGVELGRLYLSVRAGILTLSQNGQWASLN
jgi:hypothetical protein